MVIKISILQMWKLRLREVYLSWLHQNWNFSIDLFDSTAAAFREHIMKSPSLHKIELF